MQRHSNHQGMLAMQKSHVSSMISSGESAKEFKTQSVRRMSRSSGWPSEWAMINSGSVEWNHHNEDYQVVHGVIQLDVRLNGGLHSQ